MIKEHPPITITNPCTFILNTGMFPVKIRNPLWFKLLLKKFNYLYSLLDECHPLTLFLKNVKLLLHTHCTVFVLNC